MNDHTEIVGEGLRIAARTSPGAVGTVGAAWTGELTMSFIIGAMTVILLSLQIYHQVWKMRRDRRAGGE